MKKIIALLTAFAITAALYANNIAVTNVTYNSAAGTVSFNVSWENSWWINNGGLNTWDAAWVFIKRRNCLQDTWNHQYIAATGHIAASPLVVQSVPDSAGFFVHRSATGSGNIAATLVTVKLSSIPAPVNEWDFKVFAVEMTYVPEGAFYLGSGSSDNTPGEFRVGGGGVPNTPFKVTSENAINYANTANNLWDGRGYGPTNNVVDSNFPKGFHAFYAMKYEVSQGQYIDFLNSLTQDMALNKKPVINGFRNTILGSWPSFTADAKARAMNYLGWANLCSYLDWSGLAPMSEMEYEKLCRGVNNPVAGEYAWGGKTVTSSKTLQNDGTNNEGVSDIISTGTGLANLNNYLGSIQGPIRVGFAAKAGTSRFQSGAGFYGNMELTGNLYELCVGVAYNGATVFKWYAHGDGQLAQGTGLSNVTGWYHTNAPLTDYAGEGATLRGGSWTDNVDGNGYISGAGVSDRYYSSNSSSSNNSTVGGRGVRRLFN